MPQLYTPAETLILSDMDGTITKGSLVLGHAVDMHREGVANLGDLPDRWVADPKNEDLISHLAEAYRETITGKTISDIGAVEYIHKSIQEADFYSTLDRLIEAREAGSEVTLVSGSPSFLVEVFADHYGFQGVGTDYHTDIQGRFLGTVTPMFHADAKRAYVSTLDLANKFVHAYGDTRSDAPLFEVADWSVLVQPTEETLVALQGAVHEVIYQ